MSIIDLTKNCYLSGKAPAQWAALCKLYLEKEGYKSSSGTLQTDICSSVLTLFNLYPGDPNLVDYVSQCIGTGILPTSTYISTFLRAARLSQLHDVSTLDMLCQLALKVHYSASESTAPVEGTLYETTSAVFGVICDALALVRTALSTNSYRTRSLVASASELTTLLLTYAGDLSHLTATQSNQLYADASELLHGHPLELPPNLRQGLDSFTLSLSLLGEADTRFGQDADMQITHSAHSGISNGDISRPNTDSLSSISLALRHVVVYSPSSGAGDTPDAVGVLYSLFRWSSASAAGFYTTLLSAAFTCLSQATSAKTLSKWRNFIVGRLPVLLSQFEQVTAENSTDVDWRMAMQTAITSLFHQQDLLTQCNRNIADHASKQALEGNIPAPSIFNEFLQQTIKWGLFDQSLAMYLESDIANKRPSLLLLEATDQGLDEETYVTNKVNDPSSTGFAAWVNRVAQDPFLHHQFAVAVKTRFSNLTRGYDVESFSHLCKQLYLCDAALPIISTHEKVSDLVADAIVFLEKFDCGVVGNPEAAITNLGEVILFIQTAIVRFQLNKTGSKTIMAYTYPYDIFGAESNSEETTALATWFKALFDASCEGIEDNIIRSTKPRTLLRISGSLVWKAIHLTRTGKMNKEDLNNGISYFNGPLLSWLQVGVIKDLVRRLRSNNDALVLSITMMTVQSLILRSSPVPVLRLCAKDIVSLTRERKTTGPKSPVNLNIQAIKQKMEKAAGINIDPISAPSGTSAHEHPRQAIREALTQAQDGKVTHLNVTRHLLVGTPLSFLEMLWTELLNSSRLGAIDACRHISVFVFATPRSGHCSLLQLFIHGVLPSLFTLLERQQPPEQTLGIELAATVLTSSLVTAFHFERAYRDQRMVFGQPVITMARDLAAYLFSKRKTTVGRAIMQRLVSSQSFITTFPVFINGG